jgi:hypothetical protein
MVTPASKALAFVNQAAALPTRPAPGGGKSVQQRRRQPGHLPNRWRFARAQNPCVRANCLKGGLSDLAVLWLALANRQRAQPALPFGAPVDSPPCMRQRPFAIAGCRHGCPVVRQWAPHLGLTCIGNLPRLGLILQLGAIPGPRRPDHAHHRLTAGMNVNVLHRHLLLSLATMAIQGFEERGECAGKFVRLGEILTPTLGSLLGYRSAFYSGPASAYAEIGKTEAAYFVKINAEGGINGRKINFVSYVLFCSMAII